jgi:hypothetical protein
MKTIDVLLYDFFEFWVEGVDKVSIENFLIGTEERKIERVKQKSRHYR